MSIFPPPAERIRPRNNADGAVVADVEPASAEPVRVEAAARRLAPRPWRVSVTMLLAVGFGLLMFVAVGGVLLMSLAGARENNRSLLRDRIERTVTQVVDRVRAHLDPVQAQASYVARQVEAGLFDPADEADFARVMFGALSATPQVHGMTFLRPDLSVLRVERNSGDVIREDWSDRREAQRLLDDMRVQPTTMWRQPLWSANLGQTLLTLAVPVMDDGWFLGVLVSAVSVTEVSRYLALLSIDTNQTIFLLLDEKHVIAHPNLAGDTPAIGPLQPLPTVDEVGDRVLAQAFGPVRRPLQAVGVLPHSQGHIVDLADDFYVVVYRTIQLYGDRPWLIGIYAPGSQVGAEVRRLNVIALIGGLLLILSVGLTIWVGRRISRPIWRLATAARQIETLDFRAVSPLPPSRVRELDEAARAFNSMASGLTWFEPYLPRSLVRQLLSRPGRADVASEERLITVMFTDIIGSTALAERMTSVELAEFLNHHFAILGQCVDGTEGTIDKYIGDAVMAFWGAPVDQPDHALRACRAALAIRKAIVADNEARLHLGLPTVRLRISVHAGRALVGNIGAPGRINYTPLGDNVILAQRILEVAKQLDAGEDVIILISESTRAATGGAVRTVPVGSQSLRGLRNRIALHRLID